MVWLVARPCLVQRLLAGGTGHEVADCRTPGDPRVSAESLVGRVIVQKILGLLPTLWWVKPVLGVSAGPLADGARSWSLVTGPWDPRASVR